MNAEVEVFEVHSPDGVLRMATLREHEAVDRAQKIWRDEQVLCAITASFRKTVDFTRVFEP